MFSFKNIMHNKSLIVYNWINFYELRLKCNKCCNKFEKFRNIKLNFFDHF